MQKRRVIAYIDGFNFYYRRLRNKPYRWLDLVTFFEQLFPHDEIIKVKYFTARVGGKFDPTKPLRQHAYLRALQTLPRVEIIEGKFLTASVKYRLVEPYTDNEGNIIEAAQVWRPEEKGSDVNFGAHLINDAWSDAFDVAAVLTNDSDLTVPIRMAVARHKTVMLIHPDSRPSRSLEDSATDSLHIHDKHLKDSQLPDVITLASGKTVHKPDGF